MCKELVVYVKSRKERFKHDFFVHYQKTDLRVVGSIKNHDEKCDEITQNWRTKFKEMLSSYIKKSDEEKNDVIVVLPPRKVNANNQFEWVYKSEEFNNVKFFIIESPNYALKDKKANERFRVLEKIYPSWKCDDSFLQTIIKKDNIQWIFIDDILTTGLTASFIRKYIKSKVGVSEVKFLILSIGRTIDKEWNDKNPSSSEKNFVPAWSEEIDIKLNPFLKESYVKYTAKINEKNANKQLSFF